MFLKILQNSKTDVQKPGADLLNKNALWWPLKSKNIYFSLTSKKKNIFLVLGSTGIGYLANLTQALEIENIDVSLEAGNVVIVHLYSQRS